MEFLCPKTQTPAQVGVSMDEMASDIPVYASSSNDSQLDRVDGIDFQTGMRHIIAPAVFGMIVGIIFQEYITPEYNWPSPPQGAILSSIILSPLLYFILVRDKASRWFEYTLGLATPGLIFFVIWFSGLGAVFLWRLWSVIAMGLDLNFLGQI